MQPLPTPPTVRPALGEDLDPVRKIILDAYREHLERVDSRFTAAFEQHISALAIGDRSYGVIVAEHGGQVAGTVLLRWHHDGELPWPRETPSVQLLSVASPSRRKGLGRALTKECIDYAAAASCTALALQTAEFMVAARSLYEQMGFVRRPDWDRRPAGAPAALAYELPLSGR